MEIAYHEIERANLASVQKDGIRRGRSSDKYTAEIKRINSFLDNVRSVEQKRIGLSRSNVIYCYLALDSKVVDVTNGETVDPEDLIDNYSQLLLRVKVNLARSYVSDLDLYDSVKLALEAENTTKATVLARQYWQRVAKYSEFVPGDMERPELLVLADIPASDVIGVY